MSASASTFDATSARSRLLRTRAFAMGGAVTVALAGWVVAVPLLDVKLRVSMNADGSDGPLSAAAGTEVKITLMLLHFAVAADRVQEFDWEHMAQPGYAGSVVVDLGGGRRFALNLWTSEQRRAADLAVLGPQVQRLLSPLMSAPSQLIGVGHVLTTDLSKSRE